MWPYRSLKKNFLDLCIFLQSLSDKPDILILTGTWLDHNIGFYVNRVYLGQWR